MIFLQRQYAMLARTAENGQEQPFNPVDAKLRRDFNNMLRVFNVRFFLPSFRSK